MEPDSTFARITRHSAASQAAGMIRAMILEGKLVAGDRLPPERELCEALGVSRPTLRETIRSLVAMNILESRHGAGTFVASLDTAELLEPLDFVLALSEPIITELFEARLVLEPALAALAAAKATEQERAAILNQSSQLNNATDSPDAMVAQDMRLHRMIAQAARNNLLLRMLDTLAELGKESRSLSVRQPGMATHTAKHHLRIARAVAEGDATAASDAMREHLNQVSEAASRSAKSARTRAART